MSPKLLQTAAAVTSFALLTSACENLTPGENAGVFAGATALAVGIPLAVAGVDPSVTIPVTLGAAALAGVGAYVIAKQQATVRQRKIAEQRARIYLAEQKKAEEKKAAQAAQVASASKKKPKTEKKPRYIAVETVKEENSQGKAQVMVFDTQSNEIVGNNVYDLKASPKVGQTTKFDTYTAEYVGTGS